jgi:hypothetical protein
VIVTTEPQAAHARLSPSSSKRWFACPGSIVIESAFPNESNEYSDEGTACHEVAAWCLRNGTAAHQRIGEYIDVSNFAEEPRHVHFTETLADMVQPEVDEIRKLADGAQLLLVEQRVDFSKIVGVENQFGTLDVGIVSADGELQVRDFKFGHTPVSVEENTQLLIYALAAYEELSLSYEITGIRLAIHQPKVAGTTEWTCSVEYLTGKFRERLVSKTLLVKHAENRTALLSNTPVDDQEWQRLYLNPNPNKDECAFCRAMATCPAYTAKVQAEIGASFEDLTAAPTPEAVIQRPGAPALSTMMAAVPMLEDLCKAIRAEVERQLLAGDPVAGFGLELGRKGPRKFTAPGEVEELLRRKFRIKMEHVYDMSLKSPTQLEKLTKPGTEVDDLSGLPVAIGPVLGDRQWKKLQEFIAQSDPKPSVRPLAVIKNPYTVPKPDDNAFNPVA